MHKKCKKTPHKMYTCAENIAKRIPASNSAKKPLEILKVKLLNNMAKESRKMKGFKDAHLNTT